MEQVTLWEKIDSRVHQYNFEKFMTFCNNQKQILESTAINLKSNLTAPIGLEEINFISYFKRPLEPNNWNQNKLLRKCREFQAYAKMQYAYFSATFRFLWKKFSNQREMKIQISCLIIEQVTCISVPFKKKQWVK